MLRLAQHGLMQTRLTDRCPGSHLSNFATKAATNAAPSNRALALPFSSVRALEQFHARAAFHGLFYGLRNFCCKTAQSCATRRESEMPQIPGVGKTVQNSEMLRNSL